jgi:hypothetical protein
MVVRTLSTTFAEAHVNDGSLWSTVVSMRRLVDKPPKGRSPARAWLKPRTHHKFCVVGERLLDSYSDLTSDIWPSVLGSDEKGGLLLESETLRDAYAVPAWTAG